MDARAEIPGLVEIAFARRLGLDEAGPALARALEPDDGPTLKTSCTGGPGTRPQTPDRALPDAPFPTLDDAMRTHIRAALERSGGRIEGSLGAARLLGINPNTLRSRMRKLGLAATSHRAARSGGA